LIDSYSYIETVKKYFSFLVTEYSFPNISEKINGNAFYIVEYSNKAKIISISYENITDYLQIIVFNLDNGALPDFDDKSKILRLKALNRMALTKATQDDFKLNNSFFAKFSSSNQLEKQLLKASKDLRLCLILLPEL
jgi:hypothetical protein